VAGYCRHSGIVAGLLGRPVFQGPLHQQRSQVGRNHRDLHAEFVGPGAAEGAMKDGAMQQGTTGTSSRPSAGGDASTSGAGTAAGPSNAGAAQGNGCRTEGRKQTVENVPTGGAVLRGGLNYVGRDDSARGDGAFYWLAGAHLALTQTRISESPLVHTAHITCGGARSTTWCYFFIPIRADSSDTARGRQH
jgi:hypothetical protein